MAKWIQKTSCALIAVAVGGILFGVQLVAHGQPASISRDIEVSTPRYQVSYTAFIPANSLQAPPGAFGSTCSYDPGPNEGPPPPSNCARGVFTKEGFLLSYVRNMFLTGDDRGFANNPSSFRVGYRFTVFPSEASDARPNVDEGMRTASGFPTARETKKYAPDALLDGQLGPSDNDGQLNDCELLDFVGTNDSNNFIAESSRTGREAVEVQLDGDGYIAGISPAPAISWKFTLDFSSSGSSTKVSSSGGFHNKFPAYDIYVAGRRVHEWWPGDQEATSCAGTPNYSALQVGTGLITGTSVNISETFAK